MSGGRGKRGQGDVKNIGQGDVKNIGQGEAGPWYVPHILTPLIDGLSNATWSPSGSSRSRMPSF